ncbi:LacI family DNA-binding transcriptional regulator [Bifidobacterium psychraerophilum]|uniref:LacI-type transcriptional regulator n=1 Tax=Bifidobacterium psychraerophilum TaxID=218140 RepID=A0A087CJ70_9BIFI|nr:LacI family DNA-binding transcriptional regulator [Bifidobacterium psychraerophilum]KFI83320.1 LacI-type transcriptional regulator [Bifidobacterium psychraerophilum]PKA94374.1 LacI family transcriptional regulator [Bifidobacterium psychraerophilum DSM 22366]
METRKVTMKDVALESGISIKTVSNVINNNDSQMRPQTKSRVNKAIEKLGYSINHSAQALKKGRTGILGLAIPNFDQPFFGYFVDLLTKSARAHGYAIIISTFGEFTGRIDEFATAARRLNADGWIMFADAPVSSSSPLFDQDYPLVITGDYSAHGLCDMVTMPNAEAVRYVTDWLLSGGAQQVGFIGAPQELGDHCHIGDDGYEKEVLKATEGNSSLRLQGYIQALRNRDRTIVWRNVVACDRLTGGEGAKAAFELIRRGKLPDALVCANDAVAVGVISVLTKANIDVPLDVQVTGVDNLPDGEFSIPPLTTIDPRVDQYAELAVEALTRRIEDGESKPSIFSSGFRLLERSSTRPVGSGPNGR